jgi:3-isopropylmalate dehydrogenase
MKFLLLPGDGIGPEISDATVKVLRAATDSRVTLDIEVQDIGLKSLAEQGTTLPQAVLDAVMTADATILGPVSHYDYPQGQLNPSAVLRTKFELYANIRPCLSRTGLSVLPKPMDLVIVRENTEGFYADRSMHMGPGEFMPDPDSAFSIRKITARAVQRVARTSFELARQRRRKVTAVHKANVLKLTDGLFLREVRAVASEYPDIELEEVIVDAAAALLIRDPGRFDVMVTTNMFGDILSDEASELSGSLGVGGSINAGDNICVAQAQHGSAPDIAGRDLANPTSLILSTTMMLRWLSTRSEEPALLTIADRIDRAIDAALAKPETRTRDVGGALGTQAFADAVIQTMETAR